MSCIFWFYPYLSILFWFPAPHRVHLSFPRFEPLKIPSCKIDLTWSDVLWFLIPFSDLSLFLCEYLHRFYHHLCAVLSAAAVVNYSSYPFHSILFFLFNSLIPLVLVIIDLFIPCHHYTMRQTLPAEYLVIRSCTGSISMGFSFIRAGRPKIRWFQIHNSAMGCKYSS